MKRLSMTFNLQKDRNVMIGIVASVTVATFFIAFVSPAWHYYKININVPVATYLMALIYFYMEIFVLQFFFGCLLIKKRFEMLGGHLR